MLFSYHNNIVAPLTLQTTNQTKKYENFCIKNTGKLLNKYTWENFYVCIVYSIFVAGFYFSSHTNTRKDQNLSNAATMSEARH